MPDAELELRAATFEDSADLLRWRNDPETRRQSFETRAIEAAEHERWLRAVLADDGRLLLIAEEGGAAVGQLRLDRRNATTAELSITIAPGARGRGRGRRVLEVAPRVARERLGVAELVARVRETNTASLRAFEAAGWTRHGREAGVVRFVRSTC
jgi:RimJ/RimL family protein N-acetyltransferase